MSSSYFRISILQSSVITMIFFLKKIKTKIVTLFNNCKNLMRFYLLFILLL